MKTRDISTLPDFGGQEKAMQTYLREGEQRAFDLENRGPIRFNSDGTLAKEILDSYSRYGFYIFEGVLKTEELLDIEKDVQAILERLPQTKGSKVDSTGRPALAVDCKGRNLGWAKPLGDPFGGTSQNHGRHQVKMTEPEIDSFAPEEIVYVIGGSLQFSDACLRVYGHPELLAVAGEINGKDFVPFNEALFLKEPGRGASVSWHQDGFTHWEKPDWDEGTHGFNFMAQLYGCTAANGLWVVPGSHKKGKLDITKMLVVGEAERIPEAVPFICAPGDVAICNRQCIHGSFANTSPDWRVTVNFGFHRRASVLNVESGGIHNDVAFYDDERIRTRSRLIAYGINARKQRFPNEVSFVYEPFKNSLDDFVWNEDSRKDIKDYNLLDLGI